MLKVSSMLILIILTTLLEPSRSACSLTPFPFFSGPQLTFFVATGESDSVRVATSAELGVVSKYVPPPDSAQPVPDSVYGQVVRLQRVGGARAPVIRRLMERGHAEAVVVPYGYGSDCRPIVWEGENLWIDTTSAGLFWAQLRSEDEWIDGSPVLDARLAYHLPYPSGWFPHHRGDTGRPDLTIEELWSLLEVLPGTDLFEANINAALRPLDAWKQANRDLLDRFPATEIIPAIDYYSRRQRGD